MVVRRAHLGPPELLDALRAGCIPVVAADLYVLPFSEVLDWTRFGLHIYEQDLHRLADILKGWSGSDLTHNLFLYDGNLSSMSTSGGHAGSLVIVTMRERLSVFSLRKII